MRLLIAFIALLVLPVAALAADTNVVTVPWGDALAPWIPSAGATLLGVAMILVRKLPSRAVVILEAMGGEMLLSKGVSFGVNAIGGAVRGQTLDITLANPVLRAAVVHLIQDFGPLTQLLLGDPVSVARKIWAVLPLPADAQSPDFDMIAGQASAIAKGTTA